MNEIQEIEKFLIKEVNIKNENTFLYKLHYDKIFDKEKFDLLLNSCFCLIEYYEGKGKTDNSIEIIKGIIILFEHTLFLFYCNQVSSDLYKILNHKEVLSEEIIADYYFAMRNVTERALKKM